MTATVLSLRDTPDLPVDAGSLSPDRFAGCSRQEVAGLPIRIGNQAAELGDLFRVDGAGSDEILIEGDLSGVRRLGADMSRGRLIVDGDVGSHAGAAMSGGVLEIRGDADAWTGAEMTGGVLRVGGDVGDCAGAAYPGSRRGMNGGMLLIEGAAGRELGATMRRGIIAVRSGAGDHVGFNMIAGSIVLCAGASGYPGAGMKRGTIISFQPVELLPSFAFACSYRPEFVAVLFRRLRHVAGFEVDARYMAGTYQRFSGDFTELGKGEVLVWAT